MKYEDDGNYLCIDPVINPLSLNYMYESISNDMLLVYKRLNGSTDGFRFKFSSDKPPSKYLNIFYGFVT